MKATVNPLSITDVERPYLDLTASQLAAVAEQLLRSESSLQVRNLVGWLVLKGQGIDEASAPSRARFRNILRERAPIVPPPQHGERVPARGQRGLASIPALVGVTGGAVATMVTGSVPLGAAVAAAGVT